MQNLLGIPVGSDGDEYIASVYRLLVIAGRGFRNIDTDQRSDEATGDSVESARCHNGGTGCSQYKK